MKDIKISDGGITARLLHIEAQILALAEQLLDKNQQEKFHDRTAFHLKNIVREYVEDNPSLAQEYPWLPELLK